jgi:hypothetical protein
MKLMEQVRQVLRVRHYALATEQCYCQWIRRFIFFHGMKHPDVTGAEEVEHFLTHLAVDRHVSVSTQNQALNALVFLYGSVPHMEKKGARGRLGIGTGLRAGARERTGLGSLARNLPLTLAPLFESSRLPAG